MPSGQKQPNQTRHQMVADEKARLKEEVSRKEAEEEEERAEAEAWEDNDHKGAKRAAKKQAQQEKEDEAARKRLEAREEYEAETGVTKHRGSTKTHHESNDMVNTNALEEEGPSDHGEADRMAKQNVKDKLQGHDATQQYRPAKKGHQSHHREKDHENPATMS